MGLGGVAPGFAVVVVVVGAFVVVAAFVVVDVVAGALVVVVGDAETLVAFDEVPEV